MIFKELISLFYWIFIIKISSIIFANNLEYNRKFIHIMIANWWFIAMILFDDFWTASFVPFVFVFINTYATFSKKTSLVGDLKRRDDEMSFGLICYPIGYIAAFFLSFFFCEYPYYGGIGIMALGYGDGFAALVGKKYNYIPYSIFGNTKTVSGSLGMFCLTFISVYLYCKYYGMNSEITIALASAIVGTFVEAISVKGTDNILIPVAVITTYLIMKSNT